VKVINSFILATGRLAASRQQRRTERLIHLCLDCNTYQTTFVTYKREYVCK